MTVWVVTKWYPYEGEEMVGGYDTHQKALDVAAEIENGTETIYTEIYELEVQ